MTSGDSGPLGLVESSPYIVFKNAITNTGLFIRQNMTSSNMAKALSYVTATIKKLNYLSYLFHFVYAVVGFCFSAVSLLVRNVLRGIGFVIWLICEPFSLVILIIEYNIHAFIDMWLQLLFNTKLENLFQVEYGVSQIKVVAQWIRFINVMCLTGMVLGISTYYTMIRVIYWLTKLENNTKVKNKEKMLKQKLKETSDLKKRLSLVAEFEALRQNTTQQTMESPSLLDEFIEKESSRSESQQTIKIQESTPPPTSDASSTSDMTEHSFDHIRHVRIFRDDQDDDIYNYESLNSLASGSSTTVSSPLQRKGDSPLTQAFRSRLSSLNSTQSDDLTPLSTMGSSVFSSTRTSGSGLPPMTPITTIEEDGEYETEDEKQ